MSRGSRRVPLSRWCSLHARLTSNVISIEIQARSDFFPLLSAHHARLMNSFHTSENGSQSGKVFPSVACFRFVTWRGKNSLPLRMDILPPAEGKKKQTESRRKSFTRSKFRNKNKSVVIKLTSADTPYTSSLKNQKNTQRWDEGRERGKETQQTNFFEAFFDFHKKSWEARKSFFALFGGKLSGASGVKLLLWSFNVNDGVVVLSSRLPMKLTLSRLHFLIEEIPINFPWCFSEAKLNELLMFI